ncbi:MAG TPA: M23 family metallopeptidase [Micromonosporaceae bacterium]|nr:M23 family metallopeptidase [Micromonosporaceae bacterium]
MRRTIRSLLALLVLTGGATVAMGVAPAYADVGAMHQPTSGVVTSKIDWRCSGYADNHDGIDIANAMDTPVYAAYRGTVTFAGTMSGYGRIVIIDHPQGYTTRYAHLAGFRVSVGQHVSREERIGRMGSSGNSTGPHLHFEVRRNGAVHNALNQGYTCGNRVTAGNRIDAPFPDLAA